jgi:hypothetical protein
MADEGLDELNNRLLGRSFYVAFEYVRNDGHDNNPVTYAKIGQWVTTEVLFVKKTSLPLSKTIF